MSDDLSEFFAKKVQKAKEKKKKRGVVDIDQVGQQLDRRAKRQEEMDREDEQAQKRHQEDDQFLRRQKLNDDSEWFDYSEANKEIDLAECGIKDMNLVDRVEDEEEEDRNAIPMERVKTWNVTAVKEQPQQDENIAPVQREKPGVYRVPKHLTDGDKSKETPDFSNQEMFPSLAAADQIEKSKKDEEKRKEQRMLEFHEQQARRDAEMARNSGPGPGSSPGQQNVWLRQQPVMDSWKRAEQPPTKPPQENEEKKSSIEEKKSAGIYIPPSLRKQQDRQAPSLQPNSPMDSLRGTKKSIYLAWFDNIAFYVHAFRGRQSSLHATRGLLENLLAIWSSQSQRYNCFNYYELCFSLFDVTLCDTCIGACNYASNNVSHAGYCQELKDVLMG